MSSAQESKAYLVRPPVMGSVITRGHSATADRLEIPPDWFDNYVTFTSDTDTLYVAFGDSGVMVAAAKVATITGDTVVAHAGTGLRVKDQQVVDVKIPPKGSITHFAFDSDAATGGTYWDAYRSSGEMGLYGEPLPQHTDNPLVWLDAMVHPSMTIVSNEVTSMKSSHLTTQAVFADSTGPDWADAATTTMVRPSLDFVAASSERLVSTDAPLLSALGGTGAFTIVLAFHYVSTAALQTLFSVGTAGSNNGRFDVSIDASDNLLITRVTSAGASTTSAGGTTVTDADHHLVITFDGSTPLAWLDGASESLTGTAAGDVGTLSHATLGCRHYNTSTYDQFWDDEVCDLLVFGYAASDIQVTNMNNWLRRRIGVGA